MGKYIDIAALGGEVDWVWSRIVSRAERLIRIERRIVVIDRKVARRGRDAGSVNGREFVTERQIASHGDRDISGAGPDIVIRGERKVSLARQGRLAQELPAIGCRQIRAADEGITP